MAFSFVQTKHNLTTSSSTNAVTLDAPANQNDLLVINLRVVHDTATVSSVVDNVGNSYALAAGPVVITSTTPDVRSYQYYGVQVVGGATSITVTLNTSVTSFRVTVDEFGGGATSNASIFDKASSGTSTSANTSAAVPSFSPTNMGELVVAGLSYSLTVSNITAGTNYTTANTQTNTATQYRLSSDTSETAPISWTNSSDWAEIAAAYNPPSVGRTKSLTLLNVS